MHRVGPRERSESPGSRRHDRLLSLAGVGVGGLD
jgi:hypothetical protein